MYPNLQRCLKCILPGVSSGVFCKRDAPRDQSATHSTIGAAIGGDRERACHVRCEVLIEAQRSLSRTSLSSISDEKFLKLLQSSP